MQRKRLPTIVCVLLLVGIILGTYETRSGTFTIFQPLKIICLGDSITSGYRLPVAKETSFPAHLKRMSEYRWHITNAGVPGATATRTGDIPIWKTPVFTSVMSSQPDVVIVLLGTNDTKDDNWQHRFRFRDDYQELVGQLQSLPSAPRILVCSIPPVVTPTPSGISSERARELTTEVQRVAAITGTRFVDITTPLRNDERLFIDGLHPNERGDSLIAGVLMDAVTRL